MPTSILTIIEVIDLNTSASAMSNSSIMLLQVGFKFDVTLIP